MPQQRGLRAANRPDPDHIDCDVPHWMWHLELDNVRRRPVIDDYGTVCGEVHIHLDPAIEEGLR